MAVYLKKLTLFLLLFCTVSFCYSYLFSTHILRGSLVFREDAQFQAYPDTMKHLLLGTSHVKNSLNPGIIGNSFNYAHGAENTIQTYHKLKYILNRSDRTDQIETVVLPLDLATFLSTREDIFSPTAYWVKYIDFIKLGWEKGKPLTYASKPIEARLFSFFKNGQFMIDYVQKKIGIEKPSKLIHGHKPRFGDFSKTADRVKEARHQAGIYFRKDAVNIAPEMVQYYADAVDLALAHGKQVVLIKFPLTREYVETAMTFFPDGPADNDIFERWKENPNVRIFDFRSLYFDQNSLFDNSDHLNHKGAAQFSSLVNTILNPHHKNN